MPLICGSQIPYKRQTYNVVHKPLILCKLLFLRMRVVNWNFITPPWEGTIGILSIWLNPKLRCWTSDKCCNGKTEHGSSRRQERDKNMYNVDKNKHLPLCNNQQNKQEYFGRDGRRQSNMLQPWIVKLRVCY